MEQVPVSLNSRNAPSISSLNSKRHGRSRVENNNLDRLTLTLLNTHMKSQMVVAKLPPGLSNAILTNAYPEVRQRVHRLGVEVETTVIHMHRVMSRMCYEDFSLTSDPPVEYYKEKAILPNGHKSRKSPKNPVHIE